MADPNQETVAVVARLLAERFGGPVRLGEAEALHDRDHVLRLAVLDGPGGAPTSVIAKRPRAWGAPYDPDSDDPSNQAASLFGDWAGLKLLDQFTGDLELAPHFYAGDRAAGVIVIEDLGSGVRPDQLLLGDDAAAAEAVLVEIAVRLGQMHGRTCGHAAELTAIRASIGQRTRASDEDYSWLIHALNATLNVLGVTPPSGMLSDLEALRKALDDPGPFLAYIHGDPCPDNWIRAGATLRLLDFERGSFRHALLDGVYGRIHFPTCWCCNRSPSRIWRRMEASYRAELVRGCPAAADDTLFSRAVVEACAYWTMQICNYAVVERRHWYDEPRPLESDRQWGISTHRQRALLRADIFAQTAAEFGHLESIGAAFAAMAARLRELWPADADAMPLYPAFRDAT